MLTFIKYAVSSQVAGFSCCKPFLLYVEIYGCLSLIKMDVLSRLQVSHVSCQMSRSGLKYDGEGRGVKVSSDLGRTTLDNFSFKGEMESHCRAIKLASLNSAQLSKLGSCYLAATYGIQNELVISIQFWWAGIHIREPVISKWPTFVVRLFRRGMGWAGHKEELILWPPGHRTSRWDSEESDKLILRLDTDKEFKNFGNIFP